MKNILLLLLIAGGLLSCKHDYTKFRKEYSETCEQLAGAEVTDNRLVPLIHDYCECAANELIANMSAEKLEKLENPDKDPQLRAELLNITAPCLKELQQKSAALAH